MFRLFIIFTFVCMGLGAIAQEQQEEEYLPVGRISVFVINGDTVLMHKMPSMTVSSTAIGRGRHVVRKKNKLRYNVYKVYPYVKSTTYMLDEVDSVQAVLGDTPKFQKYKKEKEKAVIDQYKPVVREMTYSQGKIIVLLINRESGRACYDVIKQLRGGVQAVFWQGVAKLFDNNLKRTYEPNDRDKEIEDIVQDIIEGIPY